MIAELERICALAAASVGLDSKDIRSCSSRTLRRSAAKSLALYVMWEDGYNTKDIMRHLGYNRRSSVYGMVERIEDVHKDEPWFQERIYAIRRAIKSGSSPDTLRDRVFRNATPSSVEDRRRTDIARINSVGRDGEGTGKNSTRRAYRVSPGPENHNRGA